jgi:succinoglycan biosynthesis protein ExoA
MKFSIVITYLKEGSPEVLESIQKVDYNKKDYELLCLPGKGSPSIYRNEGADKGKSKIIAFIDDDAMVHKDLLKNAEKFFIEHPEIDIVGGPQLTPVNEKGFALISGYALSSKFGGWNTSSRYEKKKLNLNADDTYLTTAVMFCKKDVFQKIRFDENMFPGEDKKFIIDAKNAGLKVAYSPDLIVYHRRRPSMKKFVKQIFNYGKLSPLKLSEIIKNPSFFIPSIFLLYLLWIMEMQIFFRSSSLLALIPLSLYLFLDLIFSLYESLKNKNIMAFIQLLFIFPVLHLSYGTGIICGFVIKKK